MIVPLRSERQRASGLTADPPYFTHTTGGLEPLRAENTGEQMTWAAVLQRVTYGTEAREKAIAEQLWQIEQICGTDDMSSSYSR